MKYIQVDIELEQKEIEPATGLLMTLGISDTVIEDPEDLKDLMNKKAGYEWDYIDESVMEMADSSPKVTFYLEDGEFSRAEEITAKLKEAFPRANICVSTKDDSEWKDKWKEFFKPSRITERLTVKPTWEDYEPKEGEAVIEIDPGMAFGTGTHETTSLCLKLLEKYIKEGDSVLDVGCGSGILSIGAVLLGAGETLAIDIDPEAVKVSRENAAANGCEDKITAVRGDLVKGVDFKADIVLANLMADLVIMLSRYVSASMKPEGVYISSGILLEKEKQVAEAVEEAGFEILEIAEDGMWCAIAARPKRS